MQMLTILLVDNCSYVESVNFFILYISGTVFLKFILVCFETLFQSLELKTCQVLDLHSHLALYFLFFVFLNHWLLLHLCSEWQMLKDLCPF